MRTTIELKPEHRALLAEIASQRGERGVSRLIGEAIEMYLNRTAPAPRTVAAKLRGSLSPQEARVVRKEIARLRRSWT